MKKIIMTFGLILMSIVTFSQHSFNIFEYKDVYSDKFVVTSGRISYDEDIINLYDGGNKLIMSLQTEVCTTLFDTILYCTGYELLTNKPLCVSVQTKANENIMYWEFQNEGRTVIFKTNIVNDR